jgi:hypothetical protein
MSSTNHTPGPWRNAPWTCHAAVSILADTGDTRAGQPWPTLIADCAPIDGYSASAEPNARFIVRACNAHEDLLAALRQLLADVEERGFENVSIEHPTVKGVQMARAAIAKAEPAVQRVAQEVSA